MFYPIDIKSWPRAQMFHYFRTMAPTGYSLTVNVDVSRLVRTVKAHGLKVYPAYLWLVTRNLAKQQEFTCAIKDDVLGYYDELTPLYPVLHDDDHTVSLMWTAYDKDFDTFYQAHLENVEVYGQNRGILSRPELPPENAFTVSEVPWINFTHFAVHSYEKKDYFFPSVEAGRWKEEDGKLLMPLSLTAHHATTDGYHIAKFLDNLQNEMDSFEQFIGADRE